MPEVNKDFDNGKPWVGFDFDGTLCAYPYYEPAKHGPNLIRMVAVLKQFIKQGVKCKIVTARAAYPHQKDVVENWMRENEISQNGVLLEVTDKKDYMMFALFDDRAITVNPVTGEVESNPAEVARMIGGISE